MPQRLLNRFRHSQPLLLGLGFGILVAIAIATVWLVESARRQNDLLLHTLEVQNRVSRLLLDLRRAESSQRGYLLIGNPAYLSDYRESAGTLPQQLSELLTQTADNPGRVRDLQQISPLLESKLVEMRESIRLEEAGDHAGALALVRRGIGRELTENIRGRINAVLADEQALFRSRSIDSDETASTLLLMSLIGTGLIVLLVTLTMLLVRRASRERDEAHQSLEEAYAGLEETVSARTADLREANDEIQRFAYIVSHDLRSPLVNIMGFTSELEALRPELFPAPPLAAEPIAPMGEEPTAGPAHSPAAADFDEALGFIKTSIGKMDRLINAILRLSREGRRDFTPEPVDMNELIEAIIGGTSHQASAVGASVTADKLPQVTSDRLALEQVFSNLVDNALKYLRRDEPGKIEIGGRMTPTHAIYEVSDNGRGIDPKDHQRIFELFRRAGEQDRPGEGIGLAHVRALVRRLGGSLTVRSELNKGSVFTVTLPRRWIVRNERTAA